MSRDKQAKIRDIRLLLSLFYLSLRNSREHQRGSNPWGQHPVSSMFDMKLSIYEFLNVIFSSSVTDCCFTSSAGTFHPLFLISEDFATTEYFINHIKRVDFWNLYVCLKYQTYICVYIYIYVYIYNMLYIWVTPNTNQAFS